MVTELAASDGELAAHVEPITAAADSVVQTVEQILDHVGKLQAQLKAVAQPVLRELHAWARTARHRANSIRSGTGVVSNEDSAQLKRCVNAAVEVDLANVRRTLDVLASDANQFLETQCKELSAAVKAAVAQSQLP